MGVIAVGLIYDLVRRRFGRVAGFVAGLALATTPIIVAVSRHNNPDELLVLCSVAALWLFMRALDTGRTRWLVLAGLAVGLGFETKMAVALMVVPGMTLAWVWCRWTPKGGLRAHSGGQLLAGGAAMVAVACAWPLLVTIVPASDRPWISGTSDNSIWSLIFSYNGLGRLSGQTGGPGGGAAGGPGGGGGRAASSAAPPGVPSAPVEPRRSGRLAPRVRSRRRTSAPRPHAPAAPRSAHRLADRRRRRVPHDRGRVQLRVRHLPPVLRLVSWRRSPPR